MNKNNIWEWIVLMFAATICVILLANVIGVLILKIPTNADNAAMRSKLVDMLNTMYGSLITIIGFKIKERLDEKH